MMTIKLKRFYRYLRFIPFCANKAIYPSIQSNTKTKMSSNAIKTGYVEMHSVTDSPPVILFLSKTTECIDHVVPQSQPQFQFGVFHLELASVEITNQPIFILFTVDRSASMSDKDKYYNSKMHYVRNVLDNALQFIAKNSSSVTVFVRIDTFDEEVENVIDTVQVTRDNVGDLVSRIRDMNEQNSTNIEMALINAKRVTAEYGQRNPDHKIHHIFLTDGDANRGEIIPSKLAELICTDFPNIFIGIGPLHNAVMLQRFSDFQRAEYRFIDTSENAGMVYGEILHRILYPALEDVSFVIENGELFDWRTNTWTTKLEEMVLEGEVSKTYHCRIPIVVAASTDADADLVLPPLEIQIIGRDVSVDVPNKEVELLETVEIIPELYTLDGTILATDLSKYMFRQRVMEILYQCRHYSDDRSSIQIIKTTINALFRAQYKYMRIHDLMDDPFMRTLCDDLAIAYRTVGKANAVMFCGSRQGSQGRQESYTVSLDAYADAGGDRILRYPPPPPRLQRYPSRIVDIRNTVCLPLPLSPVYDVPSDDEFVSSDRDEEEEKNYPRGIATAIFTGFASCELIETTILNAGHFVNPEVALDGDIDIDNYVIKALDRSLNKTNIAYTTPSRTEMMRTCTHIQDM